MLEESSIPSRLGNEVYIKVHLCADEMPGNPSMRCGARLARVAVENMKGVVGIDALSCDNKISRLVVWYAANGLAQRDGRRSTDTQGRK